MSTGSIKSFKKYLRNGEGIYMFLSKIGLKKNDTDENYLKHYYKANLGRELNLDNPTTFSEKLQWLKLHDRNPIYVKMVDKEKAKEYAASIIGDKYLIKTYGVWNSFEDINFSELPHEYVLKCTHDSGSVVIVNDRNRLNYRKAKRKLEKGLNHCYFYEGREWAYKKVVPRIIAEQYMEDESGYELKDYKIFNFHGEPKLIQVDFDRFSDHKRNLYDTNWNKLNVELLYPSSPRIIEKPGKLDEMLMLAKRLSANIPF